MNVETAIIGELKQAQREALAECHRWRGHCGDCYARMDDAARKALIAFSKAPADQSRSRIPHLFGPRLQALRKAVSPDGDFHDKSTWKTFAKLEPWLHLRNVVVHGLGPVWINGSGDWLWQYQFVSNDKAATLQSGTIDSDLAARMETALASSTRSLCDLLRNQTAKLA